MASVNYTQDVDIPLFVVSYQSNNSFIIRPALAPNGNSNTKFARPALITVDGVVKKYIVPANGSGSSATASPIGNHDYSTFYSQWHDYFNNIPDPDDFNCLDANTDEYYIYIIPVESESNWNTSSATFDIYPRDAEFMCMSDYNSLSPILTSTDIRAFFINHATKTISGSVDVDDSGSSAPVDTSGIININRTGYSFSSMINKKSPNICTS